MLNHNLIKNEDFVLIEIKEDRLDYFNSLYFKSLINSIPQKKMIIDLKNVNYFSSSCIGALISLKMMDKEKDIKLLTTKKLKKTFDLMGISDFFKIQTIGR